MVKYELREMSTYFAIISRRVYGMTICKRNMKSREKNHSRVEENQVQGFILKVVLFPNVKEDPKLINES